MRMQLKVMLLPLLSGVLLASGCRTSDGSKAQSLDNFARNSEASLHANQCHGDYKLIEDLFSPEIEMINIRTAPGQSTSVMQARVESALRAVPTEVQVAFFGLGGIIEVTPNAHELCAQNLDSDAKTRLSEGGARIKGCWKYQTDLYTNDSNQLVEDPRVVMYIDANEGSIEHALVRTFGYVLSQVLVKLDHQSGQTHVNQVDADPEFVLAKEAVTLAFLKDVAASKGKYDLARYTRLIGSEVIGSDELARRSGWDLLKQQKPDAAKAFMDYVFAEAFDSHYCSPDTRAVMAADFNETKAAFAPVAEAISSTASDLSSVDSVDQLASLNSATPTKKRPSIDSASIETGSAAGFSLFGGRLLRGVGRVIGAIGRGVIRVGTAVVRGVARVAAGAVRAVATVARAALRFAAGVVRVGAEVVVGIFRGAVRIARGAVIGAGLVLRGSARLTLGVGRVIVRGTGTVIRGVFGAPNAFATEAGMVLEKGILDQDADGVDDSRDLCLATPAGARVHTANLSWLGCAGGQFRDRDTGRGR